MNKIRFLTIGVILLVILNLVTLFIVFNSRKDRLQHRPKDEHGPSDFIIKELKLDRQQQQEFAELRDQHQHLMMKKNEDDKQLHDLYFNLLKTDNPDKNKIDSIATLIGEQRKDIALTTFKHFQQLRTLCKNDQKKLFDNTINHILEMMVRQNGEGPPH